MSMIVDWDEKQITGLGKMGLVRIVAEVGNDGFVTRELGFGSDGRLVHRFPGTGRYGDYGLFDVTPIEPSTSGDLTQEQFDRMWADATKVPMNKSAQPTDDEFWAEHDPFGDGFAKRVPLWDALLVAAALALAGYLVFIG